MQDVSVYYQTIFNCTEQYQTQWFIYGKVSWLFGQNNYKLKIWFSLKTSQGCVQLVLIRVCHLKTILKLFVLFQQQIWTIFWLSDYLTDSHSDDFRVVSNHLVPAIFQLAVHQSVWIMFWDPLALRQQPLDVTFTCPDWFNLEFWHVLAIGMVVICVLCERAFGIMSGKPCSVIQGPGMQTTACLSYINIPPVCPVQTFWFLACDHVYRILLVIVCICLVWMGL